MVYIPGKIEILYYIFNITMVHSLVEKSQYCEQEIYVLCNGASQPSEQTGRKMSDWEPQAEGRYCKAQGMVILSHMTLKWKMLSDKSTFVKFT